MTRAEAGRLGGQATAGRYGRDYMRVIGRNGGLLGGRPTWQRPFSATQREQRRRRVKNQKGGLRVLGVFVAVVSRQGLEP